MQWLRFKKNLIAMRKNVLFKYVADSMFQERNISVIQEPKIAQKLKYPRIFFCNCCVVIFLRLFFFAIDIYSTDSKIRSKDTDFLAKNTQLNHL